ncbi:MAG: RNA polymerase sigma factor [Planctomycetota bacterium]|jgi:RNA polymerase sigma-70 factor (ECF subfamily)
MDQDNALQEACLRGDAGARDAFVDRFAPMILGTVRRVLGSGRKDPALDAEDVAQEVFLKIFKDDARLLGTYNPEKASLKTWLTIIARSTTLDHLRRMRPPSVPFEEERHEPEPAGLDLPDEPLDIPGDLLSPRQRLVMHLLFDREWVPKKVATFLRVSEQTVRSIKHKALNKLRVFFREEAVEKE